MAARGAPEPGAGDRDAPRRGSLRGSDRATGGLGLGLTEWATPHRNTPISGSAARNTFTFCCTKCFFLVFEAKPKPWPGAAVLAGTVAGGAEEDAMVSRVPDPVEARARSDPGSQPRKRRSPALPSRDRRRALKRPSRLGGRGDAGPAPGACSAQRPCGGWAHLAGAARGSLVPRGLRAVRPALAGRRSHREAAGAGLRLRSGAALPQSLRPPILHIF